MVVAEHMSHRSISLSRYSNVRLGRDHAAFIGRFHGCKLQGTLAAVECVDVGFATGCSASYWDVAPGEAASGAGVERRVLSYEAKFTGTPKGAEWLQPQTGH